MNEKLNTRVIDHIMAGIEDIAGHLGHHELRERFHRIDNKHIKPILLRKNTRKMRDRGFSILEVYKKLNEKDLEEYMKRNDSRSIMKRSNLTTAQSILNLIKSNRSETSLDSNISSSTIAARNLVDVSGCVTPLDMKVLEHNHSKKHRDDSRIHHILDEALFKPRKTFFLNTRNALPGDSSQQIYHHKARYHMRKQLHSKHRHHSQKGHASHPHLKVRPSSMTNSPSPKCKKNVCFINQDTNGHKNGRVVINMTGGGKKGSTSSVDEKSEASSEAGIIIKFKNRSDEDVIDGEDEPSAAITPSKDSLTSPIIEPVAVETSFPWKRGSEVSQLSFSSHSMPRDDQPQMCEVPSWLTPSYTAPHCDSAASPPTVTQPDTTPPQPNTSHATGVSSHDTRTSADHQGEHHPYESHINNSNNTASIMMPPPALPPCNKNPITTAVLRLMSNDHVDTEPVKSSCPITVTTTTCDQQEEFSLPPPWSVHHREQGIPQLSHLPQIHTAPEPLQSMSDDMLDDDQLSGCHLSESDDEAAVSEDNCDAGIPPPWLCSADHNPMPVLSPSVSFEMDSLHPQPSSHSLRLSEVASHHSEPYLMHHHVIDLPPRPPLDYEITSTLESLDIEDDQYDYMSRVQKWLLSNDPDQQEPLYDDHLFSDPGAADLTQSDLHRQISSEHKAFHNQKLQDTQF